MRWLRPTARFAGVVTALAVAGVTFTVMPAPRALAAQSAAASPAVQSAPAGPVTLPVPAADAAPVPPGATPGLPDGPDAPLVRTRCLTCHGADHIVSQRLAQTGWEREVAKMERWGARVTDDERPKVVAYLTRSFGVQARIPRDERLIAEGEGVYKEACRVCHEDDLSDQQRLTREAWAREVDKMRRFGARVGVAEREPLLAYLVARWGRP